MGQDVHGLEGSSGVRTEYTSKDIALGLSIYSTDGTDPVRGWDERDLIAFLMDAHLADSTVYYLVLVT